MEKDANGKRVRSTQWWREHTRVEAWAYIIYAPEGFAILETFDEYSRFVAAYKPRVAWWYNAPFDFAVLDSAKLTGGWKYTRERHPKTGEYTELASPFGARYSMTERHPVTAYGTFAPRSKRTGQTLTHYDARNLLKGGLRTLLKTFDVRDADGEPIRKREMQYQSAGNTSLSYDDILYMLDDARGLWWLIQSFGRMLYDEYQIEIRHGKPEVMTASSLAKKLLLRKMYPKATTDRAALKWYKKAHPVSPILDTYYRRANLLAGGLVMLNPWLRGKYWKDTPESPVTIWRYDYNNHYGAVLHDAPDIVGCPRIYDGRCMKDFPEDVRIFEIQNFSAVLRDGMIPTINNPVTRKVDAVVNFYHEEHGTWMIFDFELEELEKWYHISTCDVWRTWLFRGKDCAGFAEFVDDHYAKKVEAKKRGDKPRHELEKLINNGATGKFSQNPNRPPQWRELGDDGVVRLQTDAESDIEPDEASIMNIVQGAYIMARARCILRQSCRMIAQKAGKTVRECIIYTDTDSIHTTEQYDETSKYKLGWLKQENDKPIREAIFLAPKTYAEIETALTFRHEDGTIICDGGEIHCKGVNKESLYEFLEKGETLPEVYKIGREFLSNSAINVRGGKAILPMPKAVCRELPTPDELYL